jgi:hypothetical protein
MSVGHKAMGIRAMRQAQYVTDFVKHHASESLFNGVLSSAPSEAESGDDAGFAGHLAQAEDPPVLRFLSRGGDIARGQADDVIVVERAAKIIQELIGTIAISWRIERFRGQLSDGKNVYLEPEPSFDCGFEVD